MVYNVVQVRAHIISSPPISGRVEFRVTAVTIQAEETGNVNRIRLRAFSARQIRYLAAESN